MNDFKPGLEGIIAVETEIMEPDREGGVLRYRGVDVEPLVGHHPYENVWGLLVDEDLNSEMPRPEPYEPAKLTGNAPADLQCETARLSGEWKLGKLNEISDEQAREDLGRLSPQMMEIVARSAAVADGRDPAPDDVVAQGETAAERFLLRWRGEAHPDHVKAIDTYWICTAEHGLNASTFTARVVASTGADCGAALSSAVGALSGPLHGGAPAYVKPMLEEVAELGDPERWVREALASGKRIMGFGHRIYRAEDPRSRILKRTAKELGAPQVEVAEELEHVALAALQKRHPERVLATNVEYYSAIVLDVAEVPPQLAPAMFACSRVAGSSNPRAEADRPALPAVGALRRPGAAVALSCLSWRQRLRRRPRSPSKVRNASWRACARNGRTSSSPPPATPTTGSARSRTARSASSGTARSSSSSAAGWRTRVLLVAAQRSSRSSCSRVTTPGS
jgi:citrate synthase